MEESSAPTLSRAGNWAVVHLPGRKLPGLHLQGGTFAVLQMQLAVAARTLHDHPAGPYALEELDDAVKDMDAMLAFYEQVLVERGIRLPY